MESMERPLWAPPSIDIEQPSAARMYDYYLGGTHNFAADRKAAEAIIAAIPDVADGCRANRAFLQRVVRALAEAGVHQFIDIGSGIPTVGNVHDVAQKAVPDPRVVYVDIDPVAVLHARQLLADHDRVAVIQQDMREPSAIFEHPDVARLISPDEPIAVLLMAVLHFVPDEQDPKGILAAIRAAMPVGSYVALSLGVRDARPKEASDAQQVYHRTANPLTVRTKQEVTDMLDGFEVLEPGVVYVSQWRPDPDDPPVEHPERHAMVGGVARRG
jgi:O-methyltransferase involved in polyketide biosynthesis